MMMLDSQTRYLLCPQVSTYGDVLSMDSYWRYDDWPSSNMDRAVVSGWQ